MPNFKNLCNGRSPPYEAHLAWLQTSAAAHMHPRGSSTRLLELERPSAGSGELPAGDLCVPALLRARRVSDRYT